MLSKVAERVYWTARYIERVENTARLVSVYTNLLLDLPKGVNLGWYNLVLLSSLENIFSERYKNQEEKNVIKFLLVDEFNPVSVVSSLNCVRENLRTTRDVVPMDAWEIINELSIFVKENSTKAYSRGHRHELLEGIIRGCQSINGLLYGTMTHDEAWDFLRLGRNLERADMTSRLLDAGCAAIMQVDESAGINSKQIIWGNVLRSVGAEQSYRRKLRTAVQGAEVAHYLLEDAKFPRTLTHCLAAIADSAAKLPRSEAPVQEIQTLRKRIFIDVNYNDLGSSMREYLNSLQIELGQLHNIFAKQWFN
jgi:uncharacterized alpha-E superfamily protein